MSGFTTEIWVSILIAAAAAGYALYLAVTRQWEKLRGLAYRFILRAEQAITGTKRGRERFEQVLGALYALIPRWLQFFVPESSLREKLQEWYEDIKEYLGEKNAPSAPEPQQSRITC